MALRSALPADVPALAALGRDSFAAKFGHLYRDEDLLPFLEGTFSEDAIRAELADPHRLYRLAESADGTSHGTLAGYCKLGLVSGWPDHAHGQRPIELKQLYTAPDMIGQGIGAALMQWALDEARARGADEMQLSVWSGNLGAQKFYARYGFAKVADVHFMVGQQRDHEFLFARML
ncbi:MAG: GNAT family N-acetyltransferase [Novosphingobium sp.]|nr:GNAT family N-acetyltransferase [Novosphingobium sp.]